MKQLNTAVLLIVFNRPDKARQIFEAVRKAQPKKLYIAADGPRNVEEQQKCEECRALVNQVDWNCEIHTLFRETNIGCGRGPYEAINWLFQHEETGIILEDDCLPHPSFFPFCEEVLEYYRYDTRIMHVAGTYYLDDWQNNPEYSYYFSQNGSIWGWATWRRAWQYYDYTISLFPELMKKGYFEGFFSLEKEKNFRIDLFQKTYNNPPSVNTWDFQWDFARYTQNGLSVVSNINLVSNIGFGKDATHTFNSDRKEANLKTKSLKFPLKHPPFVMRDYESDRRTMESHFARPLSLRIKNRLKKILPSYE